MSARPPRRVLPLLLISGLGALLSAGGCAEPKYAEVPEGDGSSGETGTPDDDTGTGGGAGTDGTEGGDEGTDDPPVDTDGDGVPDAEDCRPEDPDIYPGATEIPYDGIDQDCVGGDLRDVDGDGYEAEVVGGEDCDDENASVNPDSIDEDNDFDDDCDGVIDEDVIVDYDRWPVVFGKDTGTVRGLGAHPLPAGGAVISCAFDGEIDIDPDPRELVPREAEGAGDDILFVAFADDRSLAMDFAISSDGDLSLSSTEVDGGGGFLLSGSFSGTVDFDDATPTFVRRSNGGGDGWFARFSDTGDIGWAYSIGGSDDDEISAALDTSAGTAVTGTLVSANLNPAGTAAASVNVNSAGLHDGFVAMYDFTQQLLWHGLVGGSEATDAAEIVDVIELGGTLYLLGAFSGTVDLDPDDSATDTVTATGAQDAFVLALDAATGAHIASATLGSAGTTLVPVAIATDGSSIAVTGTADGSLDLGTGPVATAGVDVFALTLSSTLSLLSAHHIGGAGTDTVGGLAFAPTGTDLLLSGGTDDTLTIGADSHSPVGGTDCWAARVGTDSPWLTGVGSTGDEQCPGLAVDPTGMLWLAGGAAGPIDFGTGGTSDLRPVAGASDAWLHQRAATP